MEMQVESESQVTLQECPSIEAAGQEASRESVNSSSQVFPVIVFEQGKRRSMSGALPIKFVRTQLASRSARQKGSVTDAVESLNRPAMKDHIDAISRYLVENVSGRYILPPLTLNVKEPLILYTAKNSSRIKLGYLLIPLTATLSITDGQHRFLATQDAYDKLDEALKGHFDGDGIAVMITCEADTSQIHQDFADCSKTKPIPPSLLAVYDRRNPANGMVMDIIEACSFFKDKIDSTSKNLPKKSPALFLTNQVRQLVKTLLVGAWAMGDDDFSNMVQRLLPDRETYQEALQKYVEYVNYLTERIPVWREISGLKPGIQSNRIAQLREDGWVCLTATGLVVLGTVGYDLFTNKIANWQEYAEKLAEIDWRRSADIWQGNIVLSDGRMALGQSAVKGAILNVCKAIGWERPSPAHSRSSSNGNGDASLDAGAEHAISGSASDRTAQAEPEVQEITD
jgi:DNA sulfur modification protein DndB